MRIPLLSSRARRLNRFGAFACLRVRLCLGFFALFFCASVQGGDLPISAPLSEVLTLASRRDQLNEKEGYDVERYKALWHLEHWPKVSVKDEDRIAAVLSAHFTQIMPVFGQQGRQGLGEGGEMR